MDVWPQHFALQHHFCWSALSVCVDVGELSPNKNYGLRHGCEHTEEYVEGGCLDLCLKDSSGWAKYEYVSYVQPKSVRTYRSMWA